MILPKYKPEDYLEGCEVNESLWKAISNTKQIKST